MATNNNTNNMAGAFGQAGRPRRLLYIVSFKCSRVDVFYLLDNTGLEVREGDIVIVEADRGQDLGSVQHANVTEDEARIYKKRYGDEQYRWLMMFSQNNKAGNINPNAQMFGENGGGGRGNPAGTMPPNLQGGQRDNNLKPKAIKRLANSHEISMLRDKEGNEAKAKRACQQKVAHLGLDMEILDAEWQWYVAAAVITDEFIVLTITRRDFQKLIFYYYAEHYINFKDLITELYRIYKTRIWMSAINPASFSQSAIGQPPSGIGPGAVAPYQQNPLNNAYTMMYGQDPDPYGAVPPYSIGYDTYTPNYPAIPGVTNSFPPNQRSYEGYNNNTMAQNAFPTRGDGMQGGNNDRFAQAPGPAGYNVAAVAPFRPTYGLGRDENAQAPVGTRPQFGQLGLGGGRGGGPSSAAGPSAGGLSFGRGDGAAGRGGRA